MFVFPSFEHRIYAPEQMDAPDCDADKLRRTYTQLAIINRGLSRMRGLLEKHVLQDIKRVGGPATIVEVGCGGGDVLAWLAKLTAGFDAPVRLVGIDSEARAVTRARHKLARFSKVTVLQGGIDDIATLSGGADYVFCNHMLHHIPPQDLVAVLRNLRAAARRRLLINDLERSKVAYALYTGLAAVAFHRSFVFADGRLSIRKGFRVEELQRACLEAGYADSFSVRRVRPWRVVITASGGQASRDQPSRLE